jgi:hypothetical protein
MAISRFKEIYSEHTRALTKSLRQPSADFFSVYITDDGSDATLNENYSSIGCYYVATRNLVIDTICLTLVDSTLPQNTLRNHESFFSNVVPLTSGLRFRVLTADNTVLTDISHTVPIKSGANLDGYCTAIVESFDASSATGANNYAMYSAKIDLDYLYGMGMYLSKSEKVILTLNDNLSGIDNFQVNLRGYYVPTIRNA